ncbi:MAG: hypothetical protein GF331_11105 [Chitinivibrionales bacterium]|nr:hypothetical protein [Chitinivibrionales bacterium]
MQIESGTDPSRDMCDRIHIADTYFSRRRGNCAQAVLHAFRDCFGVSAQDITDARRLGNGRAEHGYCGALSAALRLVDERNRDAVRDFFAARTGAVVCRDIRRARAATCAECVVAAAQAVSKSLSG